MLRYFVIWQSAIILITLAAVRLIPLRETFLGGGSQVFRTLPVLFSRASFDGNHYIAISRFGYGYAQQAFFPLYPSLIKKVRDVFNPDHLWQVQVSAVIGTVISLVAFAVSSVFLVKLIEVDYSPSVSRLTWLLLLLFPTSFFFTAVYTEGLFFLLLIASFYFARKGKWWLAGALAGLASYTRFIGIFIFPALVVELWQQKKNQNSKIKTQNLLPLVLAPVGLAIYMYFLWRTTGDPLAFMHTLPAFGEFRSERVILLYQVFWRYGRMLVSVNWFNPQYLTLLLEAGVGVLFLLTSIAAFAKQRLSYAVFNLAAYLVPTLTGSFVSLPRYVLVCCPSFILLAQFLSTRPKLRTWCFVASAVVSIIFLALFATGYWVA